jgi:ligand-binding sensor domain-containing protein
MSKKWLGLILIVPTIIGLMFFGCHKKSTKPKPPASGTWTTYNTSNSGLVDNFVMAIAIDSSGNKWFGTYNGVSKFDGTNWTTYNTSNSGLAHNFVKGIAIDASGNKWLGTYDGVSKFDGTNWTTYDTSNSGLADHQVTAIAIEVFHRQHMVWNSSWCKQV